MCARSKTVIKRIIKNRQFAIRIVKNFAFQDINIIRSGYRGLRRVGRLEHFIYCCGHRRAESWHLRLIGLDGIAWRDEMMSGSNCARNWQERREQPLYLLKLHQYGEKGSLVGRLAPSAMRQYTDMAVLRAGTSYEAIRFSLTREGDGPQRQISKSQIQRQFLGGATARLLIVIKPGKSLQFIFCLADDLEVFN